MGNQRKRIGADKRGISLMVGYILLVVFAVIIGAIVFGWLQTFVPSENIECPDGTSLLVTNPSFDSETSTLSITLKNTGRFNLAGYFIQATNKSDDKLPTIGLSEYVTSGGTISGSSVLFEGSSDNPFNPGEKETHIFEINESIGEIFLVSVTPARRQEVDDINRFVSCSGSRVLHNVGEPVVENVQCDDGLDNDGDSCTDLGDEDCAGSSDPTESGSICSSCTPGTEICDDSLDNDCDGFVDCQDSDCSADSFCADPPECSDEIDNDGDGNIDYPADLDCENANDDSETPIGNGVCDPGETCSEEPACEGEQASCSTGQICQSGSCEWQGGVYTENEYCVDIGQEQGLGYTSGDCTTPGFCTNSGGTNEDDEPGAETYCPGQPQPILCCFT